MKKTVLIGIPCLKTGGTEIQTLHQVEALRDGGYRCITVCYFEYDFSMVQLFERAGSKVICLSAYGRRPQSQREIVRFLRTGLKRVVDEYRPKIAHIQYMTPGSIPIFILKKLGVKTIVATCHTDAALFKSLWLVHFLQRRLLTAFICVTEAAERSFFGNSCLYDSLPRLKRHNHFTIPNCLPRTCQFVADKRFSVAEPTIGVVARLVPIKGTDLIMPAFSEVLRRFPACRLLIVGDGQLRVRMEEQQRELGIPPERVEWAGQVKYEQVADYYRRMSIVWMPSRSEGFGLSAVEAMSQGCPVVAAAVGGLTEVVADGVDGLLFRPEDSGDLAAKTIALLENPNLQEWSQKACEHARRYSFERHKQSLLDLYARLEVMD